MIYIFVTKVIFKFILEIKIDPFEKSYWSAASSRHVYYRTTRIILL